MSIIGANPKAPAASILDGKSFSAGDRYVAFNGNEFVYVQASGAITGAGYVVTIDETYQAAMISTSNDAGGDLVGVAAAVFADNDFGWVQVKGVCDIQVAASAAANVGLNTTATAGQLDDDATATTYKIDGLVLTTARTSSAGTAPGVVNYPSVAQAAISS